MSNTVGEKPRRGIDLPEKVLPGILEPHRYKVLYGGRGGTKSHTFARAAIVKACYPQPKKRLRFLCAREFQTSIAESVHRTITDEIYALGLEDYFDIQKTTITQKINGSSFIFKGLRLNAQEIKSTEGIDICWVEEAQAVGEESWQILLPTIRNEGSEVWVSFNPYEEADPTYQRFIVNTPPDMFRVKLSWRDNPWLSKAANDERLWTLQQDLDAYDWIWEGQCKKLSEATIFRNNFDIEPFDLPDTGIDRLYFGADWGFANDPAVLIRCWIKDETLFVDYEAYAVGVETDDLPALFSGGVAEKNGAVYPGVPECLNWPIFADSSRPETISYMARRAPGFNIHPADKWQGCVEDGIAHLKAFRRIKIHPRCEHTAQEFRLYSYKTDPKNPSIVLPKVVDKFNHTIDAIRYSLNGYIQARGAMGVWGRLAS